MAVGHFKVGKKEQRRILSAAQTLRWSNPVERLKQAERIKLKWAQGVYKKQRWAHTIVQPAPEPTDG